MVAGMILRVTGVADDDSNFIGGASGPTKSGLRLNASWPFALLSVIPNQVKLRGRGPLRRAFRETVTPADKVTAHAIRGPIMGGVLIQVTDGDKWLFWTTRRREVLSTLGAEGVQVVDEPRRFRWKYLT